MAGKQPKFLVSRAKGARFEPMTGFRDWLSIRDLGLEDATHGGSRARWRDDSIFVLRRGRATWLWNQQARCSSSLDRK